MNAAGRRFRRQVGRLLISCAALVASCGHSSARVVMAPDGYAAMLIRCRGMEQCLDYAAQKCPAGYEVLDRESRQTGTTYVPVGNTVVTSNHHRETMLIRCNGGVGPNDGDEQ
jgi:hypothetical protein